MVCEKNHKSFYNSVGRGREGRKKPRQMIWQVVAATYFKSCAREASISQALDHLSRVACIKLIHLRLWEVVASLLRPTTPNLYTSGKVILNSEGAGPDPKKTTYNLWHYRFLP